MRRYLKRLFVVVVLLTGVTSLYGISYNELKYLRSVDQPKRVIPQKVIQQVIQEDRSKDELLATLYRLAQELEIAHKERDAAWAHLEELADFAEENAV